MKLLLNRLNEVILSDVYTNMMRREAGLFWHICDVHDLMVDKLEEHIHVIPIALDSERTL